MSLIKSNVRILSFLLFSCVGWCVSFFPCLASSQKIHDTYVTGGLAHGSVPGYGAGYSYSLRPNIKILAEFVYSFADYSGDFKDQFVEMEKLSLSGQDLTLKTQYYVWNSLYLSGGFGYRALQIESRARSLIFDLSAEGKMSSSSFVTQFGIGNQWVISDRFTLGCQWLGFTVPIASTSESKLNANFEENPQFAETKNDLEKLSKKMGRMTTAQLLMFNAGIIF